MIQSTSSGTEAGQRPARISASAPGHNITT
jgi:hypothetical protein